MWPKAGSTAPVAVLILAMFLTVVPPTEVNTPPMYALEQSGLNAMLWTAPLTFGSTGAMAPVVWSNAKMLLRVTAAWPGDPIEVNLPTAHIWLPHCRIMYVSGVLPTLFRFGVLATGVAETVVAAAATSTAASLAADAIMVTTCDRTWRPSARASPEQPGPAGPSAYAPAERPRGGTVATPTGLEPATSAVTGRRANQLRYGAWIFQDWLYQPAERAPNGIRTRAAALKGRCPGPLDDEGRWFPSETA